MIGAPRWGGADTDLGDGGSGVDYCSGVETLRFCGTGRDDDPAGGDEDGGQAAPVPDEPTAEAPTSAGEPDDDQPKTRSDPEARRRLARRRIANVKLSTPAAGDLTVTLSARRRVVARGRSRFVDAGAGVVHRRRSGCAGLRGRLLLRVRFSPDRGTAGEATRTVSARWR